LRGFRAIASAVPADHQNSGDQLGEGSSAIAFAGNGARAGVLEPVPDRDRAIERKRLRKDDETPALWTEDSSRVVSA